MKKHILDVVKLGVFCLGFLALALFGSFHFIQTDTISAITMKEMRSREDIELAFVGSSIVRDHFNAGLITEETGLTSFCVTVPTASMPSSIAITKEMYRTSSPEWVVLVTEPYNFETVRESTEAQYKLMPYLSDPANMLDYYMRTCDEDGFYLDRLFMQRGFGAENPSDIIKTFGMRYFPNHTFERLAPSLDPTIKYQGSGFLRHETDARADALIRAGVIREYTGYTYELLKGSREQLRLYKQLCEDNGSKLLVAIYPNHTAHGLAEPGFLDYNQSLMDFCQELEIPCVNFSFAKPELMPNLDGYFFDLYHMVGEGADILSRSVARVFNMLSAGEDVGHLFYATTKEYLASIDFITNTWISRYESGDEWNHAWEQDQKRVKDLSKTQDVYMADCNHGPSVTAEYRFVLRNEDGSETLLQDYGVDTLYACEPDALKGKTLRVYARVRNGNPEEHWYDLVIPEESSLDRWA
ncbi:MAG: hypothetical protein IKK34_09365 [Clostridia bacterium]|nr:hypothetical protein [Clostridia bacterium]